jgi:hypothetical protein
MACCSISVTRALTAVAIYALTSPAAPAPITMRLLSKDFGFDQRDHTRRARSRSITRLVNKGNTPSAANDSSNPGEAISFNRSIAASWVPAFTYTSVPGSMPS